jgi:hypothetical protein
VWDEYLSSQTEVTAEPVAERISQLATELNDKAVRAAERRVAEVTRAAGEQTAQAERELADTAQTVDDLEDVNWSAVKPRRSGRGECQKRR